MQIAQAHAAADMAVTLAHKLQMMSDAERREFARLCHAFCNGLADDSYVRKSLYDTVFTLQDLIHGNVR